MRKRKPPVYLYTSGFLWARVDYASRAAKNSPLGCFCPFFCDGAAAVRIHPHENSILLQTENRQRISTLAVFLWARVDSNNHGFVPPKPLDFKKLGIMQIFGHPKWNTKPFRPGRNVKSGLQSGLFLGVRGVLGQHSGDGLRSGNITARDIMCVPAEGIHTAAVADHAAQLSG